MSTVVKWGGFGAPRWLYRAIAERNMPIIAVGAILVALLAFMLAFCIISGTPCPISGFDAAIHKRPTTAPMFSGACIIIILIMVAIFIYAAASIQKRIDHPHISMAITVLFSFLLVMLLGIVMSGFEAERQVLIFSSACFLVSGLIVLIPAVSLVYFAMAFALFSTSFMASGMMTDIIKIDLIYLGIIDLLVSFVVYTLFTRYIVRERGVADQSRRDELTGAKNRHYLRDDFQTYEGKKIYVMFCDVDDFKHYNDTFGHDVGDSLLKQFFFAFREVFGDECTYRYGGDEFLVTTPEFGTEELNAKIERVRAQLKQVVVDGKPMPIAFSGGYAEGAPMNDDEFRNMMHVADENLLEAKRQGKNRVIGSCFVAA